MEQIHWGDVLWENISDPLFSSILKCADDIEVSLTPALENEPHESADINSTTRTSTTTEVPGTSTTVAGNEKSDHSFEKRHNDFRRPRPTSSVPHFS